jgi:hypothetical protein
MLLDLVVGVGGGGGGMGKGRIPLLIVQYISDTEIQHFREIPEGRDESSAEHITVPEPKDIEKRHVDRLDGNTLEMGML